MLVVKNQNQFIFWITASCLIFMLAVILFAPFQVTNASTTEGEAIANLDTVGKEAGLVKADPRNTVGKIIKIFLGIVGAIFFVIILYAGYLYMTSGGDPTKVQTAKKWMVNGVIGLIIIFLSYSIVAFIFRALSDTGDGTYRITSTIPRGVGGNLSGSSFGEILSGHSPYPEQTNVPRNTMIVVSFKLPVNAKSLIDTAGDYSQCPAAFTQCTETNCPDDVSVCGPVSQTTFKTFRCDSMPNWPSEMAANDCYNAQIGDPESPSSQVPGFVLITEDRRTVVFNPYGAGVGSANYLGSGAEDVSYVVHLAGGSNGIQKQEPAGQGLFNDADGYFWRFTTGTLVDLTPPKVSIVIPKDQAGIDPAVEDDSLDNSTPKKVYRNQIVIANFNEPILPLFSTNQEDCDQSHSDNEAQLLLDTVETNVDGCDTNYVSGNWLTGINQYRTIQFLSALECEGVDINSCGEAVFCLPANKNLAGLLQAAEVVEEMALLGTGIADLAGNSLDGNGNGTAEGQIADNFEWGFGVGNTIDLVPPSIIELDPKNVSQNIEPTVPIRAVFDKGLDPASVDSQVYLYGEGYSGWFDPNLEIADPMTTINMAHGPFVTVPEGDLAAGPLYMPVIKSKVRDMRQNCFTPSRNIDAAATTLVTNVSEYDCTDDAGDDITAESYGVSCCPKDDSTYKPERIPASLGNPENTCFMTNIER